jgi:hypothetical protein
MSDVEALKAEKSALIAEMIDLQAKFIDREHDGGISAPLRAPTSRHHH